MQIALVLLAGIFLSPGNDDLQKRYGRCEELLRKEGDPREAIAACKPLAEQGVPGAQLALGMVYMRDEKTHPEMRRWLQAAADNGHPMAAYLLARMKHPRTREYVAMVHCAGMPEAPELLEKTGVKASEIECTRGPALAGSWSGKLEWVKKAHANAPVLDLRVVLDGNAAKVFFDGREVKPGKFRVTRSDETVIVSATDVGWDIDGKWVESWTIHILRLSAQEAFVNFVRTVNNPHVPETLPWRTFTTVAEGKVRRE